jgi:hypothetical protein
MPAGVRSGGINGCLLRVQMRRGWRRVCLCCTLTVRATNYVQLVSEPITLEAYTHFVAGLVCALGAGVQLSALGSSAEVSFSRA